MVFFLFDSRRSDFQTITFGKSLKPLLSLSDNFVIRLAVIIRLVLVLSSHFVSLLVSNLIQIEFESVEI